jgi:hypothetical protein
MKNNKYPSLTPKQVNEVTEKLGGYEATLKFIGQKMPAPKQPCIWYEKDGIIYFTLTSDGTTGIEWIERLENKGFKIGSYAKSMLQSNNFSPTKDTVYSIAILKGLIFNDENRTTNKINTEAHKRNLKNPNPEIACLIRENISDEEIEAMGIQWIVVMHDPIKDPAGGPGLFRIISGDDGYWLRACSDTPDRGWGAGNGFAFIA